MLNLFKEQVIKHGERIALLEPACGKADTYKQLDENAPRIAAKLKQQGIKHGDAVIITAERGIGYIEAMLGIIMAGGIYVPLSDHYPKERMDYICNDCRAKIIVNNSFIQDAMNMDPVDEYEDISPDDLVLIVYTSGSTGKPKGVMHDYKGVTGSVKRYSAVLELDENDRISFTAPFYFIAHLFIFAYLLCGGETYIAKSEVSGDPEMLSDFLYSNNITVASISPKVLRFFKKRVQLSE